MESFIEGINNVKTEEDTTIYIEEGHKIIKDIKAYIEIETGLKFPSGEDIRLFNIPYILQDVILYLGDYYHPSDTLIVCNQKDMLIKVIMSLSEHINFFTVVGIDNSIKEEVYEEVFQSTGISIFQPKDIGKIIKNYGIIINFSESIELETRDIRNQTIVIDYSKMKALKYLENKKKNIIYVEDINIKNNIHNQFLGKYISPELYEALQFEENRKLEQIYSKDKFTYIRKIVSTIERKKGMV